MLCSSLVSIVSHLAGGSGVLVCSRAKESGLELPSDASIQATVNQLKSFNSYTEKSQNNSFINNANNSSMQNPKAGGGSSSALGGKGRHQRTQGDRGNNIEETILEGLSEEALADTSREGAAAGVNATRNQYENDLQLLESLFKKV